MEKLVRLTAYLETMKHRLSTEKASAEKKAWMALEIRRTQLDINKITGA